MLLSSEKARAYETMLRFLDGTLSPAEARALVGRLRRDQASRRDVAALLLQLGFMTELAREERDPDFDRLPVMVPAPRSRSLGWLLAGAVAVAIVVLVVMSVRPPQRPVTAEHVTSTGAGPASPSLAPAPAYQSAAGVAPLKTAPPRVLLVRGGEPDRPVTADQVMADRLVRLGFTVSQVLERQVQAEDLEGKAVVVVSASVAGDLARDRLGRLGLARARVPVVTCENALFDALGMTGPRGVGQQGRGRTPAWHTEVQIERPDHPLAAGLEGRPSIARRGVSMSWGAPAASAIKAATLVGDSKRAALFGYEQGAPMVGAIAPARRVGCFIDVDDDPLTEDGWQLFDAAVRWAVDRSAHCAPSA